MKPVSYYRDVCDPGAYVGRFDGREPPIFIFHDVAEPRLERQLRALADRGLRGVACVDVDWSRPDPRDVVLTFDDGRASLYDVAFPLLRAHGFRATAFLSPGLMGGARDEGGWPGVVSTRLVDWDQVREMQEEEVVDPQLHGFAHSRVFVSDRIRDFAWPGRADPDHGIAAWRVARAGREATELDLLPGEPIYAHGSRWGPARRYLDPESVRAACRGRVVEAEGPDGFFGAADWRDRLERVAHEAARRAPDQGRWEAGEERAADLRRLLEDAQERITRETGRASLHFALPWAEEGPDVAEAARACGIEHLHLGHLSPAAWERGNAGPLRRHPRLKEFFLERLPGPGRPSLPRFLLAEARRLLANGETGGSARSRS